eukprot:CAMPEP_0172886534 /NCGR_PEP_ID=MMETSP1075-20121228/131292_1 /TAXON_ID=2916 /ORGANISM="Ceratium fusus, Strain PA161109" /LENGTH=232 /DNA_ID=CAMNT_0013740043 /DNA_START=116 /DNA_END=814 /DNA_ORIENTATION=-
MPPGPGAEFPGREKGNRALPVLRFSKSEMLPESREIAQWIATRAGPPLLPSDAALAQEAKDFFDKSQSLPGFWPTVLLIRFPEPAAEKIMRGEHLGDARFSDPNQTPIQSWYEGQPKFEDIKDLLLGLERILEQRSGTFFGGEQPHYGELGIFVQVDALVTLFGKKAALNGFSAKFRAWYGALSALPVVDVYKRIRPLQQGYPNSIIMNHLKPEDRRTAGSEAARFWAASRL